MIILRGNCNSNQNWSCFVCYFNIINIVLKNDMSILKQITWETQEWHYNFCRSNGSWVIKILWSITQELLCLLMIHQNFIQVQQHFGHDAEENITNLYYSLGESFSYLQRKKMQLPISKNTILYVDLLINWRISYL